PIEVQEPTSDLISYDDPLFHELTYSYIQPCVVEEVQGVSAQNTISVVSYDETLPTLLLQDISSSDSLIQNQCYEVLASAVGSTASNGIDSGSGVSIVEETKDFVVLNPL